MRYHPTAAGLQRTVVSRSVRDTYRTGSSEKARYLVRVNVLFDTILHVHAVGSTEEQKLGASVLICEAKWRGLDGPDCGLTFHKLTNKCTDDGP